MLPAVRSGVKVVIVESIRNKGSGTSEVTLEDGSFFLLSSQQILDLLLDEGEMADPDVLEKAASEHEKTRAYDKAVSLLAARDHSRVELERKLRKRSFSTSAADEALGRLESYGYIDDVRFAREFVLGRLRRHPEGKGALTARLSGRGVDRATTEQVLSEIFDEHTAEQALHEAAEKLAATGRRGEKLVSALMRRAFSRSAVRAYVRTHYPESAGEDEYEE